MNSNYVVLMMGTTEQSLLQFMVFDTPRDSDYANEVWILEVSLKGL